jgi:hypothetical protein
VLVHIVADYGHGDLAFSEVVQRIRIHLPDAEPVLTPVPRPSRRSGTPTWRARAATLRAMSSPLSTANRW